MAPVWFIPAASSGFGRETALLALARGDTVIATARNAAKLQDLKDAGADTLSFDVTSPLAELEATAAQVFAKHGRVDYLVNAAGYILEGALEETSPKEDYDIFNTNVFGIMNVFKAFLPHMRKQELGPDGVRATIAAYGSLGSWEGGASFATYAMTKASVSMLMECMYYELAPYKIVATCVEPGYFRTNLLGGGAFVQSAKRIDAYEDPSTPAGQVRAVLPKVNGNQPGDPVKGAKVAFDIITKTGVAEGKDVPIRIILGTDCVEVVKKECREVMKSLTEWEDVFTSTDFKQ